MVIYGELSAIALNLLSDNKAVPQENFVREHRSSTISMNIGYFIPN